MDLTLAEQRLLCALPRDGAAVATAEAARAAGFAQEVQALQAAGGPSRRGLVELVEEERQAVQLTAEGRRVAELGLPEVRALRELQAAPAPLASLAGRAALSEQEARVLVGLLKRNGWADVEKGPQGPVLRARVAPPGDYAPEAALQALAQGAADPAPAGLQALLERGLAERITIRTRSLRLTAEGARVAASLDPALLEGAEEVGQVTPELVTAWPGMPDAQRRRVRLRPYDFGLDVAPAHPGKAHPLAQIVAEIRDIFWKMGFQEISGDYVVSSFWNMDALFIPQDHPAREMQDTFYLRQPTELPVPQDAWERVREAQLSGGGTGSTGWGGAFQPEVSRKALLRTHTTVTTIRHLAERPAEPCKVFGVGRVFRNEAMDATHLPEFHQIEGIVMEPGASFGTLMGLLREFYARMGFPEVRFKPSYYPYTEPSLDVAVRWQGRWLELGGAGVFRPEVTHPLGVRMPVLAWGLGLERLAMLRLGLKDIRQLYLSDLQWLKENPLA
ncbi:MAG TPA: phenylalanine--tRNA ligase subunit alpha [Candidatus Thermoplasmatota archaeon]|nr:phenylalanine--tRNA ligase subunit alpha [Candidatus Thermoplasmatota archaeon]